MILERKSHINFDNIDFQDENINIPVTEMLEMFKDMVKVQQLYNAAIREVSTKLEILDDEFNIRYSHNPIHHMESRLKQAQSIAEKLLRKGHDVNLEAASEHIHDIAGIRVICHYIDDVYTIAELLTKQDDIRLIKKRDYIKSPKPNGYRSLHIVVTVPVFLSDETKRVPVEIQIRTIAMDFWASLEHQLRYKSDCEVKEDLQKELHDCAQVISDIDLKMQGIYTKLNRQAT